MTINNRTLNYDQLKAEYEKVVPAKKVFGNEWGMFRRDPSNNGVGQGGTPFLEPRFAFKMLPPDNEFMTQDEKAGFEVLKDRMDKALRQMDTKGMAPIPGTFPLAASGKLVFRGYDGIYCIATKEDKTIDPPIKPGELLWKSSTDSGLVQMLGLLGNRAMADSLLAQYTASGPHSILIENPLIGTLSHDGTTVYYVDDLAVPPHPSQWQQAMMQGMPASFGVFNDAAAFSKLKALNLETGKIMWKVGERTQGGPPGGFAGGPGGPFAPPVAIDPRTGQPKPRQGGGPQAAGQGDDRDAAGRLLLPRPAAAAGRQAVRGDREGRRPAAGLPRPGQDGEVRPQPDPGHPDAGVVPGARAAQRAAAAGLVPPVPGHPPGLRGRHPGGPDQRRGGAGH